MTENNLVESKPENPIHFTILIGTCTVILSVTLCTLCGLIAFCVAKSRKTIVCSLCKYSVLKRDWNSGIHREVCAKRNEFYLKQLPEPFDIRCPTCLRYLKLMPEVRSKWSKMLPKDNISKIILHFRILAKISNVMTEIVLSKATQFWIMVTTESPALYVTMTFVIVVSTEESMSCPKWSRKTKVIPKFMGLNVIWHWMCIQWCQQFLPKFQIQA